MVLGEPDPTVTGAGGLILIAELDRVLGIADTIDGAVGPIKERRQGHGAGGVMLALAESILAGGDFLCDVDVMRADAAGARVRAVATPPASTTVIGLTKRFTAGQIAGLEKANATLVGRVWAALPAVRRDAFARGRPTLDLDPTDVEVYGSKKQGVAYNYQGQRCGRPIPVTWAETGWTLSADLVAGNVDPRPLAAGLIARAVAALPAGLGRPRVRADAGLFDKSVAWAALDHGCDFAIAAKRNTAVWRHIGAIDPDSWQPAIGMRGADIAVCEYVPAGWPPGTRSIVRRVRVDGDDVRADPRSRRRRTIPQAQLSLFHGGDLDHVYAYSLIVTNLAGDADLVEYWFRERAWIEERIKDSKLGMALRHLPSGHEATNACWMWACLLALNLSAWTQTLGQVDNDGRAHGKRLRRQLLRVPARIVHHARRTVIRLTPHDLRGPFPTAWKNLAALAPMRC